MVRLRVVHFIGSLSGVIATTCAILALQSTSLFFVATVAFTIVTIVCWGYTPDHVPSDTTHSPESAASTLPTTSHDSMPSSTSSEPVVQSPRVTRYEARQILDVEPDASIDEIDRAYHERMKTIHPDQGGTHHEVHVVKQAYDRLRQSHDSAA